MMKSENTISKVAMWLIFIIIILLKVSYGQNSLQQTKFLGNPYKYIHNKNNNEAFFSNCDTLTSFPTRPWPSGLTWDGTNFWYVDTAYIYKVNSLGIHLDSISNPATDSTVYIGGDLTFDGTNLWYANEETSQLYKIDPISGIIQQQFNLPSFGQSSPDGFGLAWAESYIWHSQYSPSKLYKLDTMSGNIINTYSTSSKLLGIELINGYLYGISTSQKLYKIDTSNGAFLDSTNWCIPFPLGLAWDGSYLWNVSGSPVIALPTGGKQKIYGINSDFILNMNLSSSDEKNIVVYPNPATDKFFLKISDKFGKIVNIKVCTSSGKELRSYSTPDELDLQNLQDGVYFIIVENSKGEVLKTSIIKE